MHHEPTSRRNIWGKGSRHDLLLSVIRAKTGTLVLPGIAHGLPDAFGEPFMKMFTWMQF